MHDGRRLEVVADGLPLFGGVHLAVDTTLVSPLHCDGQPPWTELYSGEARRRKELTCPELVAPRARGRLVVWAGESERSVRRDQGVLEFAGQSKSPIRNSSVAASG